MKKLGLIWTFCCFVSVPVIACTIFVLTDGTRVQFFNNEDWLNPNTRIWFVPPGDGHYGCAYVGFDDGRAQGGLNTKGLAFDWVAGYMEKWSPDPGIKGVRGNPSERMLETSATVEDAIAFFQTHREPDFSRARILVADSTGASAIIRAKEGKLNVERANKSRGFGYCDPKLQEMLTKPPEPTVANGAAILRTCLQKGETATKYSNVFDLKSHDIFLFQYPERDDSVKLNLTTELAKGAHYYDIPQIRQQLTQAPIPLLTNMKRFFLDEFKPISDQEPKITEHFRTIIQGAMSGIMHPDDYTSELWKQLSPAQKDIQADLKVEGDLVSMTLVDRRTEGSKRTYRYIMEFKNARALERFVVDENNRIAMIQSDGSERKPDAPDEAPRF
jgi:hypothetical protein